MLKPQPQGQLGDAPVKVTHYYRTTVVKITQVEEDGQEYRKPREGEDAPKDGSPYGYFPARLVNEREDILFTAEQDEVPTFAKL